jgi:iron complex outermembrane receptor protein
LLAGGAAAAPTSGFEIPAEDLGAALNEFAIQSPLPVLFRPDLVKNRTTRGVHTTADPEVALRQLLNETGLSFTRAGNTLLIVEAPMKPLRIATPAIAAPSARPPETSQLVEIVVTARRRDERLQDVPLSIVAISAQTLANNSINSVADLVKITPSLSNNGLFGSDNGRFSIRGFSPANRTSPSVGVYFDEVVSPRAGNGSTAAGDSVGEGEMFDLENVQVLNGPQGTLFGRNTTGGSVLISSKKPTDRYEGYVEATYGNYDARGVQAVVNVPLTDNVKFRAGINTLNRDGYLTNLSGIGPKRYGDTNYYAYRVSMTVDVTPDIQNYTVVHGGYTDNYGPNLKMTSCTGAFPFGLLACQQMARDAGKGFYTVDGPLDHPRVWMKQWQAINTTTWNVNDHLTVKNILSYSQINGRFTLDLEGANYVIPAGALGPLPSTGIYAGLTTGSFQATHGVGIDQHNQQNYVEEFRLQGKALDNRLNWQAGLYYEKSDPRAPSGTQSPNLLSCSNSETFQCIDVFGGLLHRPTGSINVQAGKVSNLNKAVYGQFTYAVNDKLHVTGGLRYTWDRSVASAQLITYRIFSQTFTPNTPTPGCTLGALAATDCQTYELTRSKAPTWLLSADYRVTPDIMVYANYSRGYRQGSVTYNAPPPYQATQPEHVNAYEAGVKTSFDGPAPGTFNVSVFYNKLTNQQVTVNLSSSVNATTPTQIIENAGASKIAGTDIELTLRPFTGFTVDGNYEYLYTNIENLNASPIVGSVYDIIQPTATTGSRLPFAPTQKWAITGAYQFPIDEAVGKVTASATYSWTGNYGFTTGPFGTLPSVGLLNGNLNWRSAFGRPIDVSVFGTNLLGKKYLTSVVDVRSSAGFVSNSVGEPRMYGVRLRYHFGG